MTYARYRPGLPDAAVRLLADVLRGRPSPVLLDLGTGSRGRTGCDDHPDPSAETGRGLVIVDALSTL